MPCQPANCKLGFTREVILLQPLRPQVYGEPFTCVKIMFFLNLYRKARRFAAQEDGPTAVEYALMLTLVVVALLSAIEILGPATSDIYMETADAVDIP